jgi:ribose transport system substrate-binding protein
MDHSARKVLAGLGVAVLAAAIAGPVAAQSPAASGAAGGSYKIGISNNAAGNGWREEMICSMKAQALASGEVASMNVIHRTTDAAGQLADLRTLISDGVNAIVVNPADPEALNPALDEAAQAGITVVAVDSPVTDTNAYILSNDQENYGYLGAKWLFEQLGGKGDVVYMRGIAGVQADTDRDTGFKKALAENPGIKVVSETFTNWAQADGTQQITDLLNAGTHIDGVWTSGIDNVVVDAFKTAGVPFVPIVGADNSGFVHQLQDPTNYPGLVGAAVTNPGTVGGAGVALALKVLDGQPPADKLTHLTPEVWDNQTDAGKAKLAAAVDPSLTLDATWPVQLQIPGWTTYTNDQLLACKGPGEQ